MKAPSGHEVQDARTYAAWGFDYLKYDLCSASGVYNTTERLPSAACTRRWAKLSRPQAAPSSSPSANTVSTIPGSGAQPSAETFGAPPETSRDHWESMDKIGFSQIQISQYTRPGHWNDPDMLEIGNGGMTADEYRTHMSLWSMLAAPLIAGNDLRSMSDETKSILMNPDLIAIDQDPAAKPVERLATNGKVEILTRPMKDGSLVIGIFNRGAEASPASFAWSSLPAGFAQPAQIRDLWSHTAVKRSGETYTATIAPHGVNLIRVSRGH